MTRLISLIPGPKTLGPSDRVIEAGKEESSGEKPPGRKFEIYLVEPTLPQDFKGFIQRLTMLVNEMEATEVIYNSEKNSMTFWYD